MKKKIEAILKKAAGENTALDLFVPERKEFGHYSTNVALRLAKHARRDPMALGRELVTKIHRCAPASFFERVEVAAPGFINFWLTKKAVQEEFGYIVSEGDKFGSKSLRRKETVIVEYSQPNIAKELHVGHLRTTVIGDALANVYKALGYRVIRWNYLGDWGTQFGKVIAAYKLWGNMEEIKKNPVRNLAELYVQFHAEAKDNPNLERRGQEEFFKLEQGDEENRRLWRWFRKESIKKLREIYRTLGVRFDVWIGESFFEKEMRPLTRKLVEEKIAMRSEGSLIIPLEKEGLPPALIQKSDGASLYLTRDIANLEYRLKRFKPSKIFYVVGNEQALHFEQLFAVARILGLIKAQLVHVKYGLILGESGKKLATREGRTVLLEEVLEKSICLAREIANEKRPDLSLGERSAVAGMVGTAALKYAILKENRHSDVVFNWQRMLDFSGDSAPYLQYTYGRFRSMVRKGGNARAKADFSFLVGDAELALIRKIAEFPDAVLGAAEKCAINHLTDYLYQLANLANRFYESTPVIRDESVERRSARLSLVTVTARILKKGLTLLGILAPEQL